MKFKSLWRKPILWFTSSGFYGWLMISVVPYIRFSMYYTDLRGAKYHAGYAELRKGDIILTRDSKKLTTILIGGEWTHAALCLGKVGEDLFCGYEIAEMTHSNYTKSFFFDICKESDRVAILRCNDFDPAYIEKIVLECISFQGCKYDTVFDLNVAALYCSELVYQADFERRLKVSLEDIAGLGVEYISPTGLAKAKNASIVWDSNWVK